MWSEKYKPCSLKGVIGCNVQIAQITDFVKKFPNVRKRALLLYGPPGSGKTLIITLIAKEYGLELVELNADEFRNKETVEKILTQASKQYSMIKKGKILLIDEVHAIDRGGMNQIYKLIKESKFPVILIADNAYVPGLKTLHSYSTLIKFNKIRTDLIEKRLSEVLRKECPDMDIKLKKTLTSYVSKTCNGDMRAGLNDLQTFCKSGLDKTSYRDDKQVIFETLKIFFKTRNLENVLMILKKSEKNVEELFWWVEENIQNEYTNPQDLARAYEMLSIIDVIKSRIIKRQSWPLQSYCSDIMAGVSLAKSQENRRFVKYNPPKFFRPKKSKDYDKSFVEKIAKNLHISKKQVIETMPLLERLGMVQD